MKSPFLILLIAQAFTYATAHAQNVVGTWKRTAMILTVSGNTMTWDFDYAANPQMPNPTKEYKLSD